MHTIFNTTELYKFQLRAAQHQRLIGHMTSCVVIPHPIYSMLYISQINALCDKICNSFYNTVLEYIMNTFKSLTLPYHLH